MSLDADPRHFVLTDQTRRIIVLPDEISVARLECVHVRPVVTGNAGCGVCDSIVDEHSTGDRPVR